MAMANFIRDDVYAALHIGHSNASMILRALKTENLNKLPKLKKWVEGENSDRYDGLSLSELCQAVEADLVKARRKESRKGESSSKRKRATESASEKPRKKAKQGRSKESSGDDSDGDRSDEGERRSHKPNRHESPASSEIDK